MGWSCRKRQLWDLVAEEARQPLSVPMPDGVQCGVVYKWLCDWGERTHAELCFVCLWQNGRGGGSVEVGRARGELGFGAGFWGSTTSGGHLVRTQIAEEREIRT